MDRPLDGLAFVIYVKRRWAVVAVCCAVATSVAGIASLLMPKRYTATASLLIEPPAGNDPRGATAVSPVYLESLKTYERFASSDTVFDKAIRAQGLQNKFGNASIESIKRSVLKVSRPASTKIVEISATLDNPSDAQRLAEHIALQSVELNRNLNNQSTEDVLGEGRRALSAAAKRSKDAEQAKNDFIKAEGLEALQNEVADANQLKLSVEQELGKTRVELADMQAQAKTFRAGDGMESQLQWTLRQVEALRARVESLEGQEKTLLKGSAEKANLLEAKKQRRDFLDAELHSARADYELAKTKLWDAQNSAAYRGERLEIMDPGILPQRPSSPNTSLNMVLALLISLLASVAYLAVRFGFSQPKHYPRVPEYSLR
jgi:uncharacterized protein involved in exopolysaccharide biosynthesis